MVELTRLKTYCDELLDAANFEDYCPNGLQVEASARIFKLVTGVTASQALINQAVAAGADALLVHHGYFWKGEPACLTGMKGQRIGSLMRNNLSLLAYHLPLDAHPELGNNRQLAERLKLSDPRPVVNTRGLLWQGELTGPVTPNECCRLLELCLERAPLHLPGGGPTIGRIAWCTGAAQDFIGRAATLGVDAFISGEVSERTAHEANELGIHYFAAGHHATERYGVMALGQHLAEHFGISHDFIELFNPV